MRIALLTTGKTEQRGLPGALARLFPEHAFIALDDVPGRPFRGFTSPRLPLPPERIPTRSALDKLVARAIAEVDTAGREPFDLAVIVDDLELRNRDQPEAVVGAVRDAVQRHLSDPRLSPRRDALTELARTKVSLHLAVPMTESWFFGAPHALGVLGVPGHVGFHLRPGDPEDFESTDRAYMEADGAACTELHRCGFRRGDRPKWVLAGADRIHHPKGYLQWLLMAPDERTCTTYDEAGAGAVALAGIRWDRLLADPTHMAFARALVCDLARDLGWPPSIPHGPGSPITSRGGLPTEGVLRNL